METTLYKKEPVSVKPEKSGHYFAFDPNGFIPNEPSIFRFHESSNRWFGDGSDEVHPDFWLKPVSVSEVPDEKEIKTFSIEAITGDGRVELTEERKLQAKLVESGAKWMRDTMLPHFALLKEENEKLKARVSELEGDNRDLRSRVSSARHYLMGVEPNEITVKKCLIALGYNQNGH